MQILNLSTESKALIAAPNKPMSKEISTALGRMAANYSGIIEAHLPYCFIPGAMKEPDQVLVLILKSDIQFNSLIPSINSRLTDILPENKELFVLPLYEVSPLLHSIKSVRCQIYPN